MSRRNVTPFGSSAAAQGPSSSSVMQRLSKGLFTETKRRDMMVIDRASPPDVRDAKLDGGVGRNLRVRYAFIRVICAQTLSNGPSGARHSGRTARKLSPQAGDLAGPAWNSAPAGALPRGDSFATRGPLATPGQMGNRRFRTMSRGRPGFVCFRGIPSAISSCPPFHEARSRRVTLRRCHRPLSRDDSREGARKNPARRAWLPAVAGSCP